MGIVYDILKIVEGIGNWLYDKLLGPEQEFDYVSTTSYEEDSK